MSTDAGTTSGLSLEPKVAFLTRADAYPEGTRAVEPIETHMAWVFLTDTRAYKLKKPVRTAFLDFSTIEARRLDCEREVRLNRTLAPDVYLGVAPLTRDDDGRLAINGAGAIVDWLVVMRRLDRGRMLDRALFEGWWHADHIAAVLEALVRFYTRAPRVPVTGHEYRERLRRDIEEDRAELITIARLGADDQRAAAAAAELDAFVRDRAELLDARVAADRIVEGHGDLRPEHIYVGPPVAIIDCIEFNRAFRELDVADDLAFLRLECERLGAPAAGRLVFDEYRARAGDDPPDALLAFYTARRALLRAKIALWHLPDSAPGHEERWIGRAREYVRLAATHAARAHD